MLNNGSNYDYQLIIKELAKESKWLFECLWKNTGKCITFPVSIEKGLENGKTCKTKFIDGVRFMAISLSSLADELADGLRNSKCT